MAVNGASGDDNYGSNSNPMAFYSGSDLTIQEEVQTTIACSYDGPSKTGYIFIKNPTTGLWGMKSHTFSSEINTSLGRGFTIGALPTGVSDLTWGLFKGEIGEVIVYNHSVTNANFYGENAKLLDAPSYNSMPWEWAESFSSGFSRIRSVNILNGYSVNDATDLYEKAQLDGIISGSVFTNRTDLESAIDLWFNNKESALEHYGTINDWDVSAIDDMSNLFEANTTFNEDISSWDVSNVTDIGYMFNGATAFNQSLDDWNTSNVSNMKAVFKEATSFNEDISNWNVSKVTDMALMFHKAAAFNQDISGWDVSENKWFVSTFYLASSFNQPLNNWNVSNVISTNAMFRNAYQFNQPLNSWNLLRLQI